MSPISDYLMITYLSGILMLAAVTDLRVQRIPNLLTFPAAAVAVIYHGITNGASGLLFSMGGLVTGIALLFIPYLLGGMGAGDAKLLGVVGGTIGAKGVFYAFLFTAIAGGVYALALVFYYRRHFRGFFENQYNTLVAFILTRKYAPDPVNNNEPRPKLCYGLAVALGTITYMALKITNPGFFIL